MNFKSFFFRGRSAVCYFGNHNTTTNWIVSDLIIKTAKSEVFVTKQRHAEFCSCREGMRGYRNPKFPRDESETRQNARGGLQRSTLYIWKQTKVHSFISLHRYPTVFMSTFFQKQNKEEFIFKGTFLKDPTYQSPQYQSDRPEFH